MASRSFKAYKNALLFASFLASVQGQQVGSYQDENHPPLSWKTCSSDGSCTTNDGEIVLDSNWRWVHEVGDATNCYTGNEWDTSICTDDVTCAENCALEGAKYEQTYGVTTNGDSLRLNFVTQSQQKNVGSRNYLMKDENTYEMFKLLSQEFTFDVDVSNLPCGLNGALYFVSMDADGGKSEYEHNKAGAEYGVGYCDSQCPRDLKFINGLGNVEGWEPSENNGNTGTGKHGACCAEMDIWEANSISNAVTPHPCDEPGQTMCSGDSCGGTYSDERYAGTCDPDGCDFNPYRMGNHSFYGPDMIVDTNSPMTVVTQFYTDDGTPDGTLSEIKRFYVQNGEVIPQSVSTISGVSGNSINTEFCDAQKDVFGDKDTFSQHGGMEGMSAALAKGMVLVLSLWDDYHSHMLWLDSTYPTDAPSTKPGVARGTCDISSGVPSDVESQYPDAHVIFSNIKAGPIGSTFGNGSNNSGGDNGGGDNGGGDNGGGDNGGGGDSGVAQHWQQCGGNGWTGPTQCASPYTCTKVNDWYSQCL